MPNGLLGACSDCPDRLLEGEAVTGKIERIVDEKGLGFIAGEDGQDYVFHRSALLEGEPFDQLLQGAPVTFDTVHEPKGLRAEAVRVVKSGA